MAEHYEPLRSGIFRLLSFEDDSGLNCVLHTHARSSAPPYIALSYTWGPPSDRKIERSDAPGDHINLNNKEFSVTENLYDALRELAVHVRRKGCLFWVDAICINQADVEERSTQVREMNNIYANAETVFAWLGLPHSDDQARLAAAMLQYWARENAQAIEDGFSTTQFLHSRANGYVACPEVDPDNTWTAWEGIADIMTRTYWERTWTYWEATTPRPIMFFYGEYGFDELQLFVSAYFLLIFSKSPTFDPRLEQASSHSFSVVRLHIIRWHHKDGVAKDLVDLLGNIRETKCVDERDKVFTALGFAAGLASQQISVDYAKSLVDVYIDVVRFALDNPGPSRLQVLAYVFKRDDKASSDVMKQENNPALPSWVPDWRINSPTVPLDRGDHVYDPCPGIVVDAHIRGEELWIKGIVLQQLSVETMTSVWKRGTFRYETVQHWCNTILATGKDPSRKAFLDKSIRRSLDANRSVTCNGTDKAYTVETAEGEFLPDLSLLDLLAGKINQQYDSKSYERAESLRTEMECVCVYRRMAVLEDGSVAVVPAATAVGDCIAAFFGGRVLYVVRAIGDSRYRFVGECYVDGLMHGALMDGCDEERKEGTMITLV